MSQLDMKIPFIIVVTDGLKTRFFHSVHQKNGRYKSLSEISDTEDLKTSEIIEKLTEDEREQVVIIAPPQAQLQLKQLFTNKLTERVVSQLKRNLIKKSIHEIQTYLQRKDKFQLVRKEAVAS